MTDIILSCYTESPMTAESCLYILPFLSQYLAREGKKRDCIRGSMEHIMWKASKTSIIIAKGITIYISEESEMVMRKAEYKK